MICPKINYRGKSKNHVDDAKISDPFNYLGKLLIFLVRIIIFLVKMIIFLVKIIIFLIKIIIFLIKIIIFLIKMIIFLIRTIVFFIYVIVFLIISISLLELLIGRLCFDNLRWLFILIACPFFIDFCLFLSISHLINNFLTLASVFISLFLSEKYFNS